MSQASTLALVRIAGCVALASLASIASPSAASVDSNPSSSPAQPVDATAALPPLPGFFEALPVAGHPDAWVSLPTGATRRRPVVVVIHGAGDVPEWQCGGWRHATGEFPFVVCPRGAYSAGDSTASQKRYTHRGGAPLLAYIDASLAALEARYPDYVDTRTPILAGFSLGASEILALAVQDPARFPSIALIEGGASGWTAARIDAYVTGGGRRVLFGTGQRSNETAARAAVASLLARAHLAGGDLEARVVYAPVNHTFDPPLEDAVHRELPWLVAGDARWAP